MLIKVKKKKIVIISANHGIHQRTWNRDFWYLIGERHASEINVLYVVFIIPWMILTNITLLNISSCVLVGVLLPVHESEQTKTSL